MLKLLSICLLLVQLNTIAFSDKYQFDSTEEAERFDQLIQILRCPTCPNQSIYDSNSSMSAKIRNEVFNLMSQGYTDNQIIDQLLVTYADFILYKPRYSGVGVWLWTIPLIMLILGLFLFIYSTKKFKAPTKKLSSHN